MTSEPSDKAASSSSFIPRPFPPPSLRDVPEAYIISQLHRLAPSLWSKPETADCTLIVPCNREQLHIPDIAPQPPSPDPLTTGPFSTPTRTSRRESELPSTNTQRMVLKLHQDYLSAQSTFMRTLLSGSSPLDLSKHLCSSTDDLETEHAAVPQRPPRQPSSHLAAGAFPVPSSRHPRVLPSSSPHHPIIFLPVPDSKSFPHLVHYLYFGTFDYMEECLHRGVITWQGVVRNVEYLGMPVGLKALLGRYYRQWLRPNTPTQDLRTPTMEESDGDDDGSDTSDGYETSSSRDQPRSSTSPEPRPDI